MPEMYGILYCQQIPDSWNVFNGISWPYVKIVSFVMTMLLAGSLLEF
jgi:hypothetical protein